MIRVQNLEKYYGRHPALRGVSFHVERGGVVGFLGVNGAGKSTLMRILVGFIPPSAGVARVCGYDVAEARMEARRRVAYLPEGNPLYPELRVEEFLRYRARLKGLSRRDCSRAVGRSLDRCGLAGSGRRIIAQLSKGYRQRVGLAECLLTDAELLILDEPTVGLDPNQVRETRAMIAGIGAERTVFLSSHILHEVELLCRKVLIVHEGRLVAEDTPENLRARSHRGRALLVRTTAEVSALSGLERLDGVSAAADCGISADGTRLFRVEGTGDRDLQPAILRLFAERNWPLREMQQEPVRLEDIFAEITGAAG